jgi:hypothetical protein
MVLMRGSVVINPRGVSGILCECCSQVVSCSAFEAHAGKGSKRAPYDSIYTDDHMSLAEIAAGLPALEEDDGSLSFSYGARWEAGAAAGV